MNDLRGLPTRKQYIIFTVLIPFNFTSKMFNSSFNRNYDANIIIDHTMYIAYFIAEIAGRTPVYSRGI